METLTAAATTAATVATAERGHSEEGAVKLFNRN